jgi:hypothetical protein
MSCRLSNGRGRVTYIDHGEQEPAHAGGYEGSLVGENEVGAIDCIDGRDGTDNGKLEAVNC